MTPYLRSNLYIGGRFPDLASVNRELFPTATCARTRIEDYATALEKGHRQTPVVREAVEKALAIRPKTRAVIYIAGALTGVDEATKERYGAASRLLSSYGEMNANGQPRALFFGYVPHLHGTDPIKHPNVSPAEVRDIDHLWAAVVADAHVNFLDPTAHGNAIELGWAADHMIPTVAQKPRGKKLSRLTFGMENISAMMEYDDFGTDGMTQLGRYFYEYATWLKTFPNRDPREFHYRSPALLRTPMLIEQGISPSGFCPVFDTQQFLVYVRDPGSDYYGEVGRIDFHDWRDSGDIGVKLEGDGTMLSFPDTSNSLSFWLK